MAPTTQQDFSNWIGRQVHGDDGEKIGKIDDIYLDDRTGDPEWMAVTTGMFGTRVSFVPLAEARLDGDDVRVPYGKDKVKDAPNADHDGHLSPEEEMELYRHYGVNYSDTSTKDRDRTDAAPRTTKGRTGDNAMTRSEEELQVGKTQHEAGRVRLRKWVETEHVSETVPVTREEVRIEREPITEGNVDRATSGAEISEAEHTEVLHEEHAVTNKKVVPKERVRLDKEQITEEEQVEADLRKEQVSVEGDAAGKRGKR